MTKSFAPILKLAVKSQAKRAEKRQLTRRDEIQANLLNYVAELPDPRVQRPQKHLLKDILVISILAVMGGAEGWEDMENYGIAKQQWLEEFVELPMLSKRNDTFRRVFERINPEALEQRLAKWLQSMLGSIAGEIIPIDGKSLRSSYDRNQGVKALHLVTAWASEQRLV